MRFWGLQCSQTHLSWVFVSFWIELSRLSALWLFEGSFLVIPWGYLFFCSSLVLFFPRDWRSKYHNSPNTLGHLIQLCLTLCIPLDCSPPDSSIHGTLQARIMEWVAISSSRGIFLTQGSNLRLFCLLHWHVGSLPLTPPGLHLCLRVTSFSAVQ